jgi:complex III assembly factor LYRM7
MSIVHKPTLQFYRRLLKTMMKTFDGDYEMFHRTRLEARKKIYENKQLTDPVAIQEKLFFGEEVREFMQYNMIQGNLQDNGNYRFKVRPEHAMKNNGT